MANATRKSVTGKNGDARMDKVSELGRVLERPASRCEASRGKLLNRRELEREIAERRGLR